MEEIARWSKHSEQEIIDQALALAKAANDKVARHVGYYLIDAGRLALERVTGARAPMAERWRRWLRSHAAGAYFGSRSRIRSRDRSSSPRFHCRIGPRSDTRVDRPFASLARE